MDPLKNKDFTSMKKIYILIAIYCAGLLSAAPQIWNKSGKLDTWKALRNVTGDFKNGIIILSDIKSDPQLISEKLNLDTENLCYFSMRYRYTNPGKKIKGGELYYAQGNSRFSDRAKWILPPLQADGKWHTLTVSDKALVNKNSWVDGGTVTHLRLDPVGVDGGKLEIAEIALYSPAIKPIWDKETHFPGWTVFSDVTVQAEKDTLSLTDLGKAPRIVNNAVKFNAENFDSFSFRYRASGGSGQWGYLFYAKDNGRFKSAQFWSIPPLKADNQWHTVTVTSKSIANPADWKSSENITGLRLDLPVKNCTSLEISEIKLFSSGKKKASKVPVFPKKVTVNRKIKAPADYPFDADRWSDVKSELHMTEVKVSGESYFQGKMLKSPHDLRTGGKFKKFYLRREIVLKDKPVQAWLQYIADDCATAFINGNNIIRSTDWRTAVNAEVSAELVKGKNVWAFCYENARSAGGVLAELFVKYSDGSFERFHTDGTFKSSTAATKDWSHPRGKVSNWQNVIVQNGPPTAPWITKIAYRDYSAPQRFLKGTVFPATADAGSVVKVRFDFKGKSITAPFSGKLVMLYHDKSVWEEAVEIKPENIKTEKNGNWNIVFDYRLPRYITSKDVKLRLESGSLFCQRGGFAEAKFTMKRLIIAPAFPEKPVTKIANGTYGPHVVLNGKPMFFAWGTTNPGRRPDKLSRFGDAPINLVSVWCSSGFWPECGKFDPTVFDRNAEAYLRNHPDAYFMWDLTIYPPVDWAKKHKNEMCRDEKNQINQDLPLYHPNYSYASQKALQDMEEIMTRSIEYLEKSPYANRIIGYRINSGHTAEWLGWDPAPRRAVDFSAPARKGFEKFAKQHYPQLKDYSIPTWQQRFNTKNQDLLWEISENLNAVAYHDFYSNAVADMIVHLCSKAKKLLKNKKIVGTYYGYISTLNGSGRGHMRGHYALKKVLDSKTVDFLMSPQAYGIRNLGDTNGDMKPFASIRNSGIIPVIEDDTRTFNGPPANNYQLITEKSSIEAVRRNLGIAICRNEIPYLYAISSGMDFDFPAMTDFLSVIRTTGEFCLKKQTPRNAQIAVVYSEKNTVSMPMLNQSEWVGYGQQYTHDGKVKKFRTGHSVLTGETFIGNATHISRLGAPVDYLLAEDMKDHPGNYKLYIFLNCYVYDQKFLQAVEKLRQKNCTLLWLYAPGYSFNGRNALDNMKQLTGITFGKNSVPVLPGVQLNKNKKWMGTINCRISPTFFVKDSNAEVFGLDELGQPGAAAVKTGNSLSVFSCAYKLDPEFLRDLARKSGVHVFTENPDPMEANGALFTLHARFAGKKTVTLPCKTTVLDVFNKKIVARDSAQFSFDAPLHSSWLFYYGNDADILLKKLQKNR